VKPWESGIETIIHEKKYLVSPFGRRRRFHLITKENRQALYREGINFLPQTTASDLTLTSAIEIHHRIDRRYAALVLTVHDSILGDVMKEYIEEYKAIVKEVMESCALRHLGWSLPFKADIGVGPTWGECQ
jgi:DNA polymerase-1